MEKVRQLLPGKQKGRNNERRSGQLLDWGQAELLFAQSRVQLEMIAMDVQILETQIGIGRRVVHPQDLHSPSTIQPQEEESQKPRVDIMFVLGMNGGSNKIIEWCQKNILMNHSAVDWSSVANICPHIIGISIRIQEAVAAEEEEDEWVTGDPLLMQSEGDKEPTCANWQ